MTKDTSKVTWDKIGCKLSKDTLHAVKSLEFEFPTPIQTHVIPTFLKKKDIVAQAVTGSGKTLSFIIPIIELLNKTDKVKSSDVFSIILSPTTELANQIYEMFNDFLKFFNGEKPNIKLFKKDAICTNIENNKGIIIVSTPGVFAKAIEYTPELSSLDKSSKNALNKSLKNAEILILDEADRLLQMGFEAQLLTIIKSLNKQRLTALFSATQTMETDDLIRAGLRNPVRVCVKMNKGNESELNDNLPKNMANYYMLVNNENKMDILIKFIRDNRDKKIMVFLATCSAVDYYKNILSLILKKLNFLMIHKKLKSKRLKIFNQFKNLKKGVLLCTDVMARGVDIPDVDWVIQFDPPQSASNFVHRCGRTARCDQFGQTLLFLRSTEDAYLHFLKENQNVEIEEYQPEFNPDEVESYESKIQNLCIADRLLYEKSISAFLTYVMFYRKHELKYIFKLSDLNMGKLANGFGLLRIPQMAELKGVDLSDFHDRGIDLKELVYKDKSVRIVKEKTRLIKKQRRETEAMDVDQENEECDLNSKKNSQKEKVMKLKNERNDQKKSGVKNKDSLTKKRKSEDLKINPLKKIKINKPIKNEICKPLENKISKPVEKKPDMKKVVNFEAKGILSGLNKS